MGSRKALMRHPSRNGKERRRPQRINRPSVTIVLKTPCHKSNGMMVEAIDQKLFTLNNTKIQSGEDFVDNGIGVKGSCAFEFSGSLLFIQLCLFMFISTITASKRI